MGKPLEFVSLFVRRDSVRPNPAGDHAVFALCSVTKRKFVKKHEFATVYFSFLRGPKSSDTAVVSHRDFRGRKTYRVLASYNWRYEQQGHPESPNHER